MEAPLSGPWEPGWPNLPSSSQECKALQLWQHQLSIPPPLDTSSYGRGMLVELHSDLEDENIFVR